MSTIDPIDPYRSYNFLVEIDSMTRAGFRECSGLDSSQDPIEYREGDRKTNTVQKLPGLIKYSNITLKRGMTTDTYLWEWYQAVTNRTEKTKTISIVLMNDNFEEVRRWSVDSAWPSKWTGPSFNATGNEIAIETLEIAHEGLKLE